MSVSLSKGQTLSLAKESGLKSVFMGLGWDPVQQPQKKGFLAGLLGGGGGAQDIDLDASVIVFDAGKQAIDTVYFGQLNSKDGAIRHGGDNLTGEGEGDDEVIHVDLGALDPRAAYMVFTVNSFRGQTFEEVDNAVARLVDENGQREICRYTLAERGPHTGAVMASMEKRADGWHVTAHGIPAGGRTARDLAADALKVI